MKILQNYEARLFCCPKPGLGFHPESLAVANLGFLAGLSKIQIRDDLTQKSKGGARAVSRREIDATIETAFATRQQPFERQQRKTRSYQLSPPRTTFDAKRALDYFRQKKAKFESEIEIPADPQQQAIIFLRTLYKPSELLCIGSPKEKGEIGKNICSVRTWISHFERKTVDRPLFILNPLDGAKQQKVSGEGTTFRGNNNVAKFRFLLFEMDETPLEYQKSFWAGIIEEKLLPVAAVVCSANKSLHALLRMPTCKNLNDWKLIVDPFFRNIAVALGADKACRNPARFSRFPGHQRDPGKFQELLYLARWSI